jgi:hypothetical protein
MVKLISDHETIIEIIKDLPEMKVTENIKDLPEMKVTETTILTEESLMNENNYWPFNF